MAQEPNIASAGTIEPAKSASSTRESELLAAFAAEAGIVSRPEPARPLEDLGEAATLREAAVVAPAALATSTAPNPDREASIEGNNTPSRVGRLLKRTGLVASWLGVIGFAISVVAVLILVAVPTFMGWKGMVVLSGSMEPTLEVGGLALMQPLDGQHADQLAVGDILTYRTPTHNLISHRIVEIKQTVAGPTFITRGDANNAADPAPVNPSQVVGKVRFDVPYVGRAIERLRDRTTYYAVISIPAMLLIFSELAIIIKEIRKSRSEKRSQSAVAQLQADTTGREVYS
ncbi:MAG TPA: signal peptidase I [Dehalococcoidia bacterium]|nr:signal peptidase I [Dehalococcoidia bacterium]